LFTRERGIERPSGPLLVPISGALPPRREIRDNQIAGAPSKGQASSLAVPLSPTINTVAGVGAARLTVARRRCSAAEDASWRGGQGR
jgi:hypothetical protein